MLDIFKEENLIAQGFTEKDSEEIHKAFSDLIQAGYIFHKVNTPTFYDNAQVPKVAEVLHITTNGINLNESIFNTIKLNSQHKDIKDVYVLGLDGTYITKVKSKERYLSDFVVRIHFGENEQLKDINTKIEQLEEIFAKKIQEIKTLIGY